MKKLLSTITLIGLCTVSHAALAQGQNDTTRPSTQTLPMPKLDPKDATAPEFGANNQVQKDFEAKLIGGIMLGASVPLFLYGLSQLGKREGFKSGRDVAAHRAGSQMFAGLGMAAQGTTILLKESNAAKKRAHLAPNHYNNTLPLLQKEAERARSARNTGALLLAVGGILTGAAVGALPVSDRTVDRRALILTGLGIAGAGIAAGVVRYNTDAEEEKVFKEAVEQYERRVRLMKKQAKPSK